MSAHRAITWLIEPDEQNLNYTLSKRNRIVLEEVSLSRAMRHLKSRRESGEAVHRIFPGGRVVDITDHFKDKPRVANPRRIRFGFTPFRR